MNKKISVVPSGISLVDSAWGGFYRGGTYLVVGPHKSGRTLVGLHFAMECARQKETCLYFTSVRPKDLMIQAASIDFNLEHYMNQNLIIVVRVAPPANLEDVHDPDEFLVEYMNDVITVVEQYQPSKIVFDELTPFIGYRDVNLLRDTFLRTLEVIEDTNTTSLFILGEPVTPAARKIVEAVSVNSTGVLKLQKKEGTEGSFGKGKFSILPNIGHNEGSFSCNYSIEAYKGIVTDFNRDSNYGGKSGSLRKSDKYRSLAEITIPTDDNSFTNYYNPNDFALLLNNQIALFKSTGQNFEVISFRLNPEAAERNLLNVSQLANAIRLATDKKDKICLMDNKILVLITKEDKAYLKKVIGRIKNNLPRTDADYLARVLRYISFYEVKLDETVNNVNDVISQINNEEMQTKFDSYNY